MQETIYGSGHIIEGKYPYPGMAQPPVPFDYRGQINSPADYPVVNDSLKILYGIVRMNDSEIRLTYWLSVTGIYDFPYQSESGPVIRNVDKNGTVTMSFNNESIWLGAGETWTSPVTDVVLEIVNVTSCVYDYVENGRKLTVTYDNRTIVYRGVETHSSRIAESESSTGNYTEYQKEVSATNALSGVMVTTGYSYILASNFSYKIENLGIYDKSVLGNTGT